MINLKGYNIVSVHQENRSKILQTFFLHAPISRIAIAKITSLKPPTITTNVTALMEAGLVRECAENKTRNDSVMGRKPILLDIVNDAAYAEGYRIMRALYDDRLPYIPAGTAPKPFEQAFDFQYMLQAIREIR